MEAFVPLLSERNSAACAVRGKNTVTTGSNVAKAVPRLQQSRLWISDAKSTMNAAGGFVVLKPSDDEREDDADNNVCKVEPPCKDHQGLPPAKTAIAPQGIVRPSNQSSGEIEGVPVFLLGVSQSAVARSGGPVFASRTHPSLCG